MAMMVVRTIVSTALFAACVCANGQAFSQSPAKSASLAQAKPAGAQASSSWTCPFADVEIAPVSHDRGGRPSEWVMVHRVKGEIVAAERIRASEVAQIRAMPCGAQIQAPQPPLLG
jgi:hypothetical protein